MKTWNRFGFSRGSRREFPQLGADRIEFGKPVLGCVCVCEMSAQTMHIDFSMRFPRLRRWMTDAIEFSTHHPIFAGKEWCLLRCQCTNRKRKKREVEK